jgi:hypothetical protein
LFLILILSPFFKDFFECFSINSITQSKTLISHFSKYIKKFKTSITRALLYLNLIFLKYLKNKNRFSIFIVNFSILFFVKKGEHRPPLILNYACVAILSKFFKINHPLFPVIVNGDAGRFCSSTTSTKLFINDQEIPD